MSLKRVVITGRGVVSPLGKDLAALMAGIAQGKSAVKPMSGWEKYKGLRSRVGAPIDFVDEKEIPRKNRRSMGRLSVFGTLAAQQAAAEAQLSPELLASNQTGCIMGSTMGGAEAMNEAFEIMIPKYDVSELSAMSFFKCVSHTVVMNAAQFLGIKGYVTATSGACASSLQALGLGYELIRSGRQNIILCGGAEELHPIVTGTFDILFAASSGFNDQPLATPRPFDAKRDGLVCGEGAGVLVLEEYEHAKKRGAKIFGEVAGYATRGSGSQVSQSDRESMRTCIQDALTDSGMRADQIDFISAHATATAQGDQAEAEAIADIFGSQVPVNSLKGYIGHTLGASGAIELAAALEMMTRGKICPTLNLENIDPACAGISHVTKPLKRKIDAVLKNSFAFGGINSALICKKAEF